MQPILLPALTLPAENTPGKRRFFFPEKLKLLALAVLLVFGWHTARAQTTVTVGTGTGASSTNVLFSTSTTTNKYARTVSVYTAAELSAAGAIPGNITSVSWFKGGSGEYAASDIQLGIYMKPVSYSIHPVDPVDWATEVTGATQVYSSSTAGIPAGTGWKTYTLTTPFLWNGTDNVEILVDFFRPGTPSGDITWQYTAVTKGATATQVNSAVIPTVRHATNRPNVQLTLTPAAPCTTPPTAGQANSSVASVCAGTAFNLSVTGASFGAGQIYQWQRSADGITGWADMAGATMPNYTTSQTSTNFYRLKVTCSGQDGFSGSVQVTTNATTVSGTFTINKNAAASATNFISLTDAIASITCRSVSGPVVFDVVANSGPYNEQVIITPVGGASATNTITINGNNNVVSFATNTTNRSIIRLDGADYFVLNNLRLETTDATYGIGIQFMNGADNNVFSNNTITIASTSTTEASSAGIVFSNSATSVTTTGNTGNNNVISGNTVTGGFKGIHVNSDITTASNNQLKNNFIKDFYSDGIVVNAAAGTVIEGNDISRPLRTTTSTTFTGIEVNGNAKQTLISKNRIHNTHGGATTKTGTVQGIILTGADAPAGQENRVQNNLIYDVNNTGSVYGLYNSSSDGAYYYHNTVAVDNTNNTGLNRGFYQTTAATNIKFINNIVTIASGATGAKHAIYLATTTSGVTSNNNVLRVTGGAATSGIGSWGTANQVLLSNWRSASSQDIASVSEDPQYAGVATADFTPTNALVNNGGQGVGVADDIMGLVRNPAMPDAGAYEFMNLANDLGISAVTSPNSVCGLTSAEVITVVITNFGTNSQSNIPVSFTLNGGAPVTETYSGTLAPGTSVTFTFTQPVDLSAAGGYTLVVSVPGDANPANDAMTKTVTNSLFPGLPISLDFESLTTGLTAMKQVTNSQSSVTENAGAANGAGSTKGMVMAGVNSATWTMPIGTGNPWTMNPDYFAATYICFNPGGGAASDSLWLTFNLKQLYKGANSNTNFRVTVNGTAIGGNQSIVPNTYRPPFGGSGNWEYIKLDLTSYKTLPNIEIGFESSVSEAYANGTGPANLVDNINVVRRLVSSTKDDFLQQQLTVYPNPSAGMFTVLLPQTKTYTLEVSDLTGKVMQTRTGAKGNTLLQMNGTAKGIYLLKVSSADGIAVKKLILE